MVSKTSIGLSNLLYSPQSFSEQLSWVADNYEAASQIGQKGKELAYNDFSYLSQAKKALSIMNNTK